MNNIVLPNFLIIGAARSGTTGLYNNIIQHPEIDMPVKKEIHFFSYEYQRGVEHYSKYFKDFKKMRIGEASVSYTYPLKDNIAKRIHEVLGSQVKLVYLIREPVSRTISHYNYYRYYGLNEERAIEKALAENPIYIGSSRYLNFIKQYIDEFGQDNLHIMLFEEYINNPIEEMRKLFDFLGVDNSFMPEDAGKKTNETFRYRYKTLYKLYFKLSRSPLRFAIERRIKPARRKCARNIMRKILGSRNTTTVNEDIKRMLEREFIPDIIELEQMLGRDLSIWTNQYNIQGN